MIWFAGILFRILKTGMKSLKFAELFGNCVYMERLRVWGRVDQSHGPGFNLKLFPFLAVEWENYITFLNFSFLYYTMKNYV